MKHLLFIIALVILAAVGGRLGHNAMLDPILGIQIAGKIDYPELRQLAIRLDRITDQLDAVDWVPRPSQYTANLWTLEVARQFEYEGLAAPSYIPPYVVYALWDTGMEHGHVAGRSDCEYFAALNLRYSNPLSHWSESKTWLATLTHELAHVQQTPEICRRNWNFIVENAAQVMTWETLAGLANYGNKYAAYTLAYELRSVAISAARAVATEEEQADLARVIYGNDPEAMAKIEKSARYWSERPGTLASILRNYSYTPLRLVIVHRNDGAIEALPTTSGKMPIDDLLYYLAHVEELIHGHLQDS